MLRIVLAVAVVWMPLVAALPAVAVPLRLLLSGLGRILELAERIAQGLDLLLVGMFLDLSVIEHFRDLLHVTQHVIELIDNGQHFQ
jgi:uncharacterized membrane protein